MPITIELQLVDSTADCAPLAGYAVYLWHCNRDGEYSQISLSSDNVFGEDEAELQLATVTGSVEAGYTVALTAGLAIG